MNDEDLRRLITDDLVAAHRARALTPDLPVIRGTAQNPDAFFQAREACNPFYQDAPEAVQAAMDDFAKVAGRKYHLFDYVGHPEAERIVVMMGSGAEVAHETVEHLVAQGEKVGLVKVRLYRPFTSVTSWRRCPGPPRRWRCSTAPRSRARSASRCTRTWSPRCARRSRPTSTASTTRSPSSAAATAFPPRSSPRRW